MTVVPAPARLIWLDALRGMTIVLMVMGHVARGLWAGGRIGWEDYPLYDSALYVFHVPLFFVLSGFALRLSKSRLGFWDEWPRRLGRLARPYMIWALITATLTFALGSAVNQPIDISAYLKIVLGVLIWPYSIFWFLYVLILCQIAMALLRERFDKGAGHILAISLAGLAFGYVIRAAWGWVEAFQISAFFPMFFFFSWGHWLGGRPEVLTRQVLWVSCAFSMLCWFVILHSGWRIDTTFGAFAGFCITTFLISLVRRSERAAPSLLMAAAAYLGMMSLEIYMMHHLLAGMARMVLNRLGVDALWVYVSIGTAIGIAGPILALVVFQRIGIAGLLGLPRQRPALPVVRGTSKALS